MKIDREIMKKKPIVLIYSDCYIFGGSERLISFLIKNELIKSEYDLSFSYRTHSLYRRGLKNEYLSSEIKVFKGLFLFEYETLFYQINLFDIPKFIKKAIKFPIWFLFKTGLFDLINIFIQYLFIKLNKPDILHINNGGYPAARTCRTMVIAAWFAGCKRIVFQVNNQATKPKTKLEIYFDKLISSKVNYFITASRLAKQILIENRSFVANKIVQIPNTISVQNITKTRNEILMEYNIPIDSFIVCEVAFLEYRKGQHLLIEALEKLQISNQLVFENTFILFIGSGADMHLLRAKASINKNIEKHIIFAGYKSDSINYINACDLFALPSIANEDMPLVILTAMSLGKTIVATSFAGIKEQIEDNVSGVLLSPNPETLAQELTNTILKFQAKSSNYLGLNAKQIFNSTFSEIKYAERIISLYKTIEK